MGSIVEILLWALIILDSGGCSVSLPEITDGNFIHQCVMEHNSARSAVSPAASNMLYMTWDEGLAITARAWARHCLFEHNTFLNDVRRVHPTFSSVGENIWTGYPPSSFDVAHSIKRWVDEKQDYDYDSDSCTKVCGHYTQVVWARSYKVGCAAQLCPNGVKNTEFGSRESVIFVCNYAPAGNVARKKPYETKGTECSGCEGKCESRLCRSQERDSQKSYNWSPDWDPAVAVSGSNYVSILIARPIALIFTFITAYVVHHFYPDVFCYE
ncbi:GLIPR1-like protein 1 [Dicentrarchus labrax]|uniref:SCP domain-containing protein n=1 Tax=Dicentrarchus labrax TaxID=13489 RepID=A0A8C4DQE2_DICLA|nr:GLIPR1-like protein 1 [Dicentrarchus labrax]XP_051248707.1 GLIPR1-like protein 1 [Dicentrarchus labrax]